MPKLLQNLRPLTCGGLAVALLGEEARNGLLPLTDAREHA